MRSLSGGALSSIDAAHKPSIAVIMLTPGLDSTAAADLLSNAECNSKLHRVTPSGVEDARALPTELRSDAREIVRENSFAWNTNGWITAAPRGSRSMLHAAGISLDTVSGRARATELLQGRSMRFVPGALADAIVAHNGLDRSTRERLRRPIVPAIETPDAVARIQRDLGTGN